MIKRIIFLVLVISIYTSAQEVNIDPYLRQIEAGNIFVAKKNLEDLKSKYPDNPSVKYLEAVLTEDGSEAVKLFDNFYRTHNNNRYADDAVYRLYSYYYSLGVYNKANFYYNILKNSYSSSPYLTKKNVALSSEITGNESYTEITEPVNETVNSETLKTEETPEPEISLENQNVEQAQYTVQAGAFMNVKNAVSLKDKLNAEGYETVINTKEVGGSILNIVTAGKFSDEQSANSLLDHLSKKYKLKGRIVSLK